MRGRQTDRHTDRKKKTDSDREAGRQREYHRKTETYG